MDNAKATILVVDDVPDNIMVLSDVLASDYEVLAATNGERALKIMESDVPPDMVLLDVMMPGMNGFEVCRRIKGNEATSFIPVVMVTALSGVNDRVEAINAGADDFLTKPFEPIEVQARVRSLLRVKTQHDELQKGYSDLQKLEELRMNLTHMIIHDLRTPLTAIIGGLNLVYDFADIEGNAAAEEMHEMASINSHRLLEMINVLLDITKMESGEMKVVCTPVNVSEVVSEVDGSMRALAKVNGLEFHDGSRSRPAQTEGRPRNAAPCPGESGRQRPEIHSARRSCAPYSAQRRRWIRKALGLR